MKDAFSHWHLSRLLMQDQILNIRLSGVINQVTDLRCICWLSSKHALFSSKHALLCCEHTLFIDNDRILWNSCNSNREILINNVKQLRQVINICLNWLQCMHLSVCKGWIGLKLGPTHPWQASWTWVLFCLQPTFNTIWKALRKSYMCCKYYFSRNQLLYTAVWV